MRRFITAILCVASVLTYGQDRYTYITLDVNTPLSNTEWIGSTSVRGLKAGLRGFINDKISAGVDVTFGSFDQYVPTETIYSGNTAFTTDYFRYIYTFSIAGSGQYNFKVSSGETFIPYAGLGLGVKNNQYVLYYNAYEDSDKSWGFLVRPEAGVLVKFSKTRSIGALAAVHYDYSTNKSDLFDYNNFSAIGFQIGLMFMRR